jgi:hypothetical protein
MHECKRITDAPLKNKLTGQGNQDKANPTLLVAETIRKLELPTQFGQAGDAPLLPLECQFFQRLGNKRARQIIK